MGQARRRNAGENGVGASWAAHARSLLASSHRALLRILRSCTSARYTTRQSSTLHFDLSSLHIDHHETGDKNQRCGLPPCHSHSPARSLARPRRHGPRCHCPLCHRPTTLPLLNRSEEHHARCGEPGPQGKRDHGPAHSPNGNHHRRVSRAGRSLSQRIGAEARGGTGKRPCY